MASPVATAVSSSITTAIAAAITAAAPVLRKYCVREAGSISRHGGKGQDEPKACGTDQRGDFHVQALSRWVTACAELRCQQIVTHYDIAEIPGFYSTPTYALGIRTIVRLIATDGR